MPSRRGLDLRTHLPARRLSHRVLAWSNEQRLSQFLPSFRNVGDEAREENNDVCAVAMICSFYELMSTVCALVVISSSIRW